MRNEDVMRASADPRNPTVPISEGSRRSRQMEVGGVMVTHASFGAGCFLDRHRHDRPVLAVMLGGSFDLAIGARARLCQPATVFTEPAGETHSNRIGTRGANVVVIQPGPERDLPSECSRLLLEPRHFQDAHIATIGRRIRREFAQTDDLRSLCVESLALEMLTAGARRGRAERADREPPAWLTRVTEMVHDRFLEGPRIADLAKEAGVHRVHLARVFRARYKISVGRYMRKLRLEWAADRLIHSDDSLSRIASQADFSDQSHFTRAFRKHAGVPPGAYRTLNLHAE